MEIVRNSRDAKVSLPVASSEDILSVTIENAHDTLVYSFGDGEPEAVDVLLGGYIDRETGIAYMFDDANPTTPAEKGVKFDLDSTSITVPYDFVTYCGRFSVRWVYKVDGEEYVEQQQHDVIQPLFSVEELKEFDPDFETISDGAIRRLERIVRAVIERITGQSFELTYGTEIAKSHNGGTLVLPKRAVALDGHVGMVAGIRASVESDGWIVRALQPYSAVSSMYSNPIYDPMTYTAFKAGNYRLKGKWGYTTVPEQIALAAMLLAQDYGCREAVWRDRYVENMKNANWSVQFGDKAFTGTGNVKVDLILQSYTLNKMAVI